MLRITVFLIVLAQGACAHVGPRAPDDVLVAPLNPAVAVRYPAMLLSANVEGFVTVRVGLDSVGRMLPGSVRILSTAHELFSIAVRRDAQRWMFPDMGKRGRAPRDSVTVEVHFYLRDAAGCPGANGSSTPLQPLIPIVRERLERGAAGRFVLIVVACFPTGRIGRET